MLGELLLVLQRHGQPHPLANDAYAGPVAVDLPVFQQGADVGGNMRPAHQVVGRVEATEQACRLRSGSEELTVFQGARLALVVTSY